jgi:hypothetical protein
VQDLKEKLQDDFLELANNAGCYIHPNGWMDYDVVKDLGGDRFIFTEANTTERINRAQKVAYFMDATVRLMLDMLVEKEPGIWKFESNDHKENPYGSAFESLHHLFCNATNVPTIVCLNLHNSQLKVKTHWMYPKQISLEEQQVWPIPVRLQF